MKTEPVTLVSFMAAFSNAADDKKQASLVAGLAVLLGTSISNSAFKKTYLTQRQLAARYSLNETTVWRWHFPFQCWGGVKRYETAECDAYLQSEALALRRKTLCAERQTTRKPSKRKK